MLYLVKQYIWKKAQFKWYGSVKAVNPLSYLLEMVLVDSV